MSLFRTEPQHREKAAIWALLSTIPLYASLAAGFPWRWIAVNLPMDLGTGGGEFTSDIDLLACLLRPPGLTERVFRAWEVKVSLLHADGSGRSLKAGKMGRTLTQLNAYRRFGIPEVSLLDVYLCESGLIRSRSFPPPVLHQLLLKKFHGLHEAGFGYQILPFELEAGRLRTYNNSISPLRTTFDILATCSHGPADPFKQLAARVDEFFDRTPHSAGLPPQVVFCRACRTLQKLRVQHESRCPACRDSLIEQS